MSYALRNTIILLVVLVTILGLGYAYFAYVQQPQIDSLESVVSERETELRNKQNIVAQLADLQVQFEESSEFIENFPKTLFRTSDPDQIYRFLSILSATDPVTFDYIFNDSTMTDQYGVVQSQVTGQASHRALLNFISRIEHSEPVQKINNITITPTGAEPSYNHVNFTFNIRSYFDRLALLDAPLTPGISERISMSTHNSYYPLIRSIEPNVDGLTNVEDSRLVGMGANVVYLLNQNGRMVTHRENDQVYLGRLISIDVNAGIATFRLNKGGIIETVTMEVQR